MSGCRGGPVGTYRRDELLYVLLFSSDSVLVDRLLDLKRRARERLSVLNRDEFTTTRRSSLKSIAWFRRRTCFPIRLSQSDVSANGPPNCTRSRQNTAVYPERIKGEVSTRRLTCTRFNSNVRHPNLLCDRDLSDTSLSDPILLSLKRPASTERAIT